jgi:NTP pyrophosphatase (non-canonical NTP hydrolase)
MFIDDVEKFNKMYNLPCNSTPTNLGLDKLKAMHSIIAEEVNEFHDIIENYDETNPIDTMVDVADILCDLIVYCNTFAKQWGIPVDDVLKVIMQSNFSKLDGEGNVIKDDRGKIMKGEGVAPLFT